MARSRSKPGQHRPRGSSFGGGSSPSVSSAESASGDADRPPFEPHPPQPNRVFLIASIVLVALWIGVLAWMAFFV